MAASTARCRRIQATLSTSPMPLLFAVYLLAAVLAETGCAAPDPRRSAAPGQAQARATSVCPPFLLRDEAGNVIDPVKGVNDQAPYSPKQTCGANGCHDYAKITEGFHFTQGRGESPTEDQRARLQWVTTPGFYGGSWCSPGPLYNYLSAKQNDRAVTIDLTSFSFITAGCGQCHPGGGSAEVDRDGRRYDQWMADPASGLTSGGENGLDGDYYKARWSETGVLEADCLICHLPEYSNAKRKAQLAELNFRWAATAGSGLAQVSGSVGKGDPVAVAFDRSRFDSDGKVSLHLVREPRNEACLECHAQPSWKKRGANYRARTDVHLRAGLRCVDCHPAGRAAEDPRITGREVHQFGKGDDPGGHIRDDLDDTMVSCTDCHDTGRRGAPKATHSWLPRLHLERLACQTCHIPERDVMPIAVQASDVFNADTKIPGKGKHLWTFYGPDAIYRNHYGFLSMMGYDDKPTDAFRPWFVRYKGKIRPANRVHTAWPGIETAGKQGLMQPRMSDIYRMWTEHRQNPARFPLLAQVLDDTGDGVPEVNRPGEIDALIASVDALLHEIGWPMESSRVVYVQNERVYASGTEYYTVDKHPWEASPFGNVHTYNHDIYPAQAALGAGGCRECHAEDSPIFHQAVLERPFGDDGLPVFTSQASVLQYDGAFIQHGGVAGGVAFAFKWLTIVVITLLIGHIVLDASTRSLRRGRSEDAPVAVTVWVERLNIHFRAHHLLLLGSVGLLFLSGLFMFGLRFPGAAWASALTGAMGGVDFWRVVHRIGGAGLMLTGLLHLGYSLLHPEGRRDFALMLPRRSDIVHLGQNLAYFFRKSNNPPAFGRFSYFEKFDYWAVFWGCVIMIGSGLVLWFPGLVLFLFPTLSHQAFDAFQEAHAHEALLAFLAIVIWHVYNVHLRADRFPGTWLWVHGRTSAEEKVRDHPAE